MNRFILPSVTVCVLSATAFATSSAQAYLDPGSGSMLLQVVLGGLAVIGVAARLYWHRFSAFPGSAGNSRAVNDIRPGGHAGGGTRFLS